MLKDLYNTQAHLGHQKKYRTPQLKEFIYKCHNGIDIINLDKTVEQIERIAKYLNKNDKNVLLISSRDLERKPNSIHEINFEQIKKWKPGYISNFRYGKLKNLPDIIIIDKVAYNRCLVNEAKKANIIIIGICDTNTPVDIISKLDFKIIINDDSNKAIDLVLNKILS